MSQTFSTLRSIPKRLARRVPAAVILAVLSLAPAAGHAQSLREEFWVPDGPVHGIAVAGGAVYLGGEFTRVGPPIGAFAAFDATSGTAQPPFAGVGGDVRAVVSDGAGGWYIGGNFSVVRGLPRANLAHLDAAGNATAWNPGTNSSVLCLARDPATGVVYAGGLFDNAGGQARQGLAAIDAGGAVTPWNAGIQSGFVYGLALANGVLYAGGSFTNVAGNARLRLAAFDPATAALTGWDPEAGSTVTALAAHVAVGFPPVVTVYLGGTFSTVGGQPRASLAAVYGESGAVTAWNPGASGTVNTIALAGGSNPISNPLRIYVGGTFLQVGGTPREHLAQLTEAGTLANWIPGCDGNVSAILLSGSLVYVGGDFGFIGGQARRGLAAIDRTTALATPWDPSPSGPVRALAVSGTSVAVGGEFCTAGGLPRSRLAALDLVTGLPTAWDPGADAPVHALLASGEALYAGGDFTQVAGQTRQRIAALDVATGTALAWDPGANGTVYELAMGDGVVYAAGDFSTIGGQSRTRLAALGVANAQATPWNPAPSAPVYALAVDGSSVYAGGSFASIGGQPRGGIAELDAATGLATAWNPAGIGPFAAPVMAYAVARSGSHVYVGGHFEQLGGRPRSNLAVLDAATGVANTWDPYTDFYVRALAPVGATVFVGGGFAHLGGLARSGIAELDGATGVVLPWQAPLGGAVRAMAVHQGSIYVSALGRFVSPHGTFMVMGDPPLAVADAPVEPARPGLRASPNPFRSDVALRFALPRAGQLEVTVHDLAGRLVRRLDRGVRDAGPHEVAWDGRDESGRRAGAGVYFARVESGSSRMTAKVLRIE